MRALRAQKTGDLGVPRREVRGEYAEMKAKSQQNQYCEPCHDNVMILLCHAPDDVVQERRDARGHGHAHAVLRDVLAHVLVVVVNTQSVVLRAY